jgi:hypothetical protein
MEQSAAPAVNYILILICAVVLGLIPALIARRKGRNFWLWWLFGTMFFLVALVFVLVVEPKKRKIEKRQLTTGEVRRCPYCAEIINIEAIVCVHCNREIPPAFLPEEKLMGEASKVLNIFFEPRRVFESLKVEPTWLIPFLIVILLAIGSFYYTYPLIIDQQVERIEEMEQIPEARKLEIIDGMREKDSPPLWQLAIPPVFGLIVLVVVAGVLFFVFNVLLGGDSTYRRVLSVYSYSGLVLIPAMIVKFPLVMIKGDLNVQTSLALLLSANAKDTFLYSVFSSFDIFNFWQVILVSMGMGVMYKYSTKKAFVAVLVLWIIYILAKSGLSTLLGGAFSF